MHGDINKLKKNICLRWQQRKYNLKYDKHSTQRIFKLLLNGM